MSLERSTISILVASKDADVPGNKLLLQLKELGFMTVTTATSNEMMLETIARGGINVLLLGDDCIGPWPKLEAVIKETQPGLGMVIMTANHPTATFVLYAMQTGVRDIVANAPTGVIEPKRLISAIERAADWNRRWLERS